MRGGKGDLQGCSVENRATRNSMVALLTLAWDSDLPVAPEIAQPRDAVTSRPTLPL